MAQQQCPNCGQDLPSELGQHASAPMSGQVTCPSCGTDVNLGEGANETPSGDFERPLRLRPDAPRARPSAATKPLRRPSKRRGTSKTEPRH